EVAQQVPEFGFFNRAYLFRDYAHAYKTFTGAPGQRYADTVAQKMDLVILAPTYLGTRQVNLRTVRDVKGPPDLAGVKLRMPGGPDWLLLGQSLGVTPTPIPTGTSSRRGRRARCRRRRRRRRNGTMSSASPMRRR